jgi:hypothetical protein
MPAIEVILMVTTSFAAQAVTEPVERAAILDAARAPVAAALRMPVLFRVGQLRWAGDWAFLLADMEERGGAPLDYRDTPMSGPAAQRYLSRRYAALLRRTGDHWTVIEKAIGPGDVAWAGWAKRHGAPEAIFASAPR